MEDSEEKVRKTVSLTHKQLGISGGVLAAMLMLNPVKQWFFTREEGVAQSKEITELRHSQEEGFKDLKSFIILGQEDQMHKLERLNDKVIERIKDAESRSVTSDARQEKRIETLEQALLLSGKYKKTN